MDLEDRLKLENPQAEEDQEEGVEIYGVSQYEIDKLLKRKEFDS